MITLTRKEAQQVLECLFLVGVNHVLYMELDETEKVIETLRAKLSEPEPEPVTTDFIRRTNDDYVAWCKTYYQADALDEFGRASLHGLWAWQEQECRKAAPPQREWVGLTDEEAEQIIDAHWNDPSMFIEAIEAKLKEKNT